MRTLFHFVIAIPLAQALIAQTSDRPVFDVASVKPSPSSGRQSSNVPLGPGDAFSPTGGYFNATGMPLAVYIMFAYKITGRQIPFLQTQLPAWVATDRYDIQARIEGNPSKDQMRLMVQSLLAERFKLAIHNETRELPVAALVLAKEGKLGPQIQPHPADAPCPLNAAAGVTAEDPRFPLLCGGLLQMQPAVPGRIRFGGRNITIEFIAGALSNGNASGRPLVDRTGLTEKFDFTLEWTLENPAAAQRPDADPAPLSFEEALREQLGFKVESQKAPVSVFVLDHVERPSAN